MYGKKFIFIVCKLMSFKKIGMNIKKCKKLRNTFFFHLVKISFYYSIIIKKTLRTMAHCVMC